MVEVLVHDHHLSVQRAWRVVRLSRTAYYRPPVFRVRADAAVIAALTAVVAGHDRWGFWKCFHRRRLQRRRWNHKRGHRVHCALGLNLPRRTKRRVPQRLRQPLPAPPVLNQTWARDFMSDTLYEGRRFRILTTVDEGNCEGLTVEADISIPSARVVRILDELVVVHGRPAAFRVDNGPELTAEHFVAWCASQATAIHYIQPGKPDQDASIKCVNRSDRTEVLDAYLFESISEVRQITDDWLKTYNRERPHVGLGQVPPLTFLPRHRQAGESPFAQLG